MITVDKLLKLQPMSPHYPCRRRRRRRGTPFWTSRRRRLANQANRLPPPPPVYLQPVRSSPRLSHLYDQTRIATTIYRGTVYFYYETN